MTIRTTMDGTKTILQVGGADKLIIHDTGDVEAVRDLIAGGSVIGDNLFGVEQSWTNVSDFRGIDVTFTNTTGKPIIVSISCVNVATPVMMSLVVNEHRVSSFQGANGADRGGLIGVVPNGGTYLVTRTFGTIGNFDVWTELR